MSLHESIFFTSSIVAVVPVAGPEDEMGVPSVTPVRKVIPASVTPATNSDISTAAADQTVVGYNVNTPSSWYGDLVQAQWLELPGIPDEEGTRYRIVGRIGYVGDGFMLAGYCQLTVERVEG